MRFDDQRPDIEELIAAVARRHKALLTADDPIFMTVTLHELLLERALKQLAANVTASQDHIVAGTTQYFAASQELGERLVTEATKHLLAQLREATDAAADAVKFAAATEIRNSRKASEQTSLARQSAWWAAIVGAAAAAIAFTIAATSPLFLGGQPTQFLRCGPVVPQISADR